MTAVVPSPPESGFFAGQTVHSLAAALRAGQVTPLELVDHALREATRLAPRFNAFVTLDACAAREAAARAAEELAAGVDRGPLHGIPVAIKDLVATAGLRTTMGARHFASYVPARDAECVRRLRAAGAIVIGKTTTHEFAYGATGDRSANGAARNPYRAEHMSGGSSAGSAVAVAAGIVPLAVGTDTGGSVRIPAALCGIVGLRPTQGAVPTDGVFPLSRSLDTVGPMARTAADCWALWQALTTPVTSSTAGRAADPAGGLTGAGMLAGTGGLAGAAGAVPDRPRIGWLEPNAGTPADPAVSSTARARLDDFDAEVAPAELPGADDIRRAYSTVQGFEAYAVHAARLAVSPDQYDDEVRGRLRAGARITEADYQAARRTQQRARLVAAELLRTHDLLAMPTVGVVAPRVGDRLVWVGERQLDARDALLGLTATWSMTGLPALSIPAGLVDGLPVGLQLVAPAGGEELLLSVAARFEESLEQRGSRVQSTR
jgi:aspartyl-tRNA(Asn)/glutamyl-tRNA(Gln) amidotransferase subunit A